MNVLHVITGRGPTGPAAAAMNDVRALLAAGHKAWIASRSGSGLHDACTAAQVPYLGGLKLGRGAMRLLRLAHDVSVLRQLVRENNIDIVHVHRSDDQLLATAALRKHAVKLVRTWHRAPARIPRALMRRLVAATSGCLAVAREHEAELRRLGDRPTACIPGAVDVSVFKPRPQLRGTGPVHIGQVGRWKRERNGSDRGQSAALQVFAGLRDGNWRASLIGRGEEAERLRALAFDTLKLPAGRVQLLDVLQFPLNDFAQALAGLDLGLVFCTGGDGTSRAALELLASGVPLLVADIPGLRELADKSGCVTVLPADNTGAWVQQIQRLLENPRQLENLSRAARLRAETTHTYKERGGALVKFYTGLR